MSTSRYIYIAGPMSGLPGFNYAAFDKAVWELALAGFVPLSPADPTQRHPEDSDRLAPGVSYEDCLAAAIEKLFRADAVATLPGWEQSHGARIAVALATRRGMEVGPVQEWVGNAHPGAAFGLPPVATVDPVGPFLGVPGTRGVVLSGAAGNWSLDPVRRPGPRRGDRNVCPDGDGRPGRDHADASGEPDAPGRQAPRAELRNRHELHRRQ